MTLHAIALGLGYAVLVCGGVLLLILIFVSGLAIISQLLMNRWNKLRMLIDLNEAGREWRERHS